MNVFKEIKEIAKCVQKIHRLAEQLDKKIDTDGIHWESAQLVSMTKEQLSHLNLVDNECYVDQHQGYLEDDFYGWLYYKTNVAGQYVKVHFTS